MEYVSFIPMEKNKSSTENVLCNSHDITQAYIKFISNTWRITIPGIDEDYLNLDLPSIINFNLFNDEKLNTLVVNNGASLIFIANKELLKDFDYDLCLELKKYNETLICGKLQYHYRVIIGSDSFIFTKEEIFPNFIGSLPNIIYITIKANK